MVRLMEIEKPCPFEAFTRFHFSGPIVASTLSSYLVLCNSFPPCSLSLSKVSHDAKALRLEGLSQRRLNLAR